MNVIAEPGESRRRICVTTGEGATCSSSGCFGAVVQRLLGPSVGEQVGVIRLGRPEDLHDARQRGAGAHVQRFGHKPRRIDADHASRLRTRRQR